MIAKNCLNLLMQKLFYTFYCSICFYRVSLKQPNNRPLTTDHLQTDQPTTENWPPTNRPPTSKKFEDQKNIELIFDIWHKPWL